MSTIVSKVASGKVANHNKQGPSDSYVALTDNALLIAIIALALFGAVMIASASMAFAAENYANPFYFAFKQLLFLAMGLLVGAALFQLPLSVWERYGPALIIVSLFFLTLVLFIGKEVNGSKRWLDLGVFTIQVSEAVKLFVIVYLAGYLVRRGELVKSTFGGFAKPLLLILIASALLLLEPDFGAAFVIVLTACAMLFVAGVQLKQFAALIGAVAISGALLIALSPYRARRFASFLDPFADPFDSGFQLSQSLIAIGSGSFTGSGLGNSVQKLSYLPEAHTDFLFAVLCEELGFLGVLLVVSLYGFIFWKSFKLAKIADQQGNRFAGYLALGIGVWIGLQSFINMGVNMGILPTKGITLPMMSYGGSSAIIFAVAFSLLLRIEWETRQYAKRSLRSGSENGVEASYD
jgi:cell division protein FtsW